mgnify:CR=1 FL=1
MYRSLSLNEDQALKETVANRAASENPFAWRETLATEQRTPIPEITVTPTEGRSNPGIYTHLGLRGRVFEYICFSPCGIIPRILHQLGVFLSVVAMNGWGMMAGKETGGGG